MESATVREGVFYSRRNTVFEGQEIRHRDRERREKEEG
jgi:hypothetical protein